MKQPSNPLKLALFITSLWIMSCLSALLAIGAIQKELSIAQLLVFLFFAIAAPFFCWVVYWAILGYKWGIYSMILGYDEDKVAQSRMAVSRFSSPG